MRLDLAGKTTRARYVRIARTPADGTPPAKPTTLQLRNAVVFGKKLYCVEAPASSRNRFARYWDL